jgi:hypothetical protein
MSLPQKIGFKADPSVSLSPRNSEATNAIHGLDQMPRSSKLAFGATPSERQGSGDPHPLHYGTNGVMSSKANTMSSSALRTAGVREMTNAKSLRSISAPSNRHRPNKR